MPSSKGKPEERKPEENFIQIRKSFVTRKDLSGNEKMLLLYLYSSPPDWKVWDATVRTQLGWLPNKVKEVKAALRARKLLPGQPRDNGQFGDAERSLKLTDLGRRLMDPYRPEVPPLPPAEKHHKKPRSSTLGGKPVGGKTSAITKTEDIDNNTEVDVEPLSENPPTVDRGQPSASSDKSPEPEGHPESTSGTSGSLPSTVLATSGQTDRRSSDHRSSASALLVASPQSGRSSGCRRKPMCKVGPCTDDAEDDGYCVRHHPEVPDDDDYAYDDEPAEFSKPDYDHNKWHDVSRGEPSW